MVFWSCLGDGWVSWCVVFLDSWQVIHVVCERRLTREHVPLLDTSCVGLWTCSEHV